MKQAKVTETNSHQDMLYPEFEAHPGEYHLIKIDKQGNEIPGTDMSIAPITYNRTYSRLTSQYKVKKSPESNR